MRTLQVKISTGAKKNAIKGWREDILLVDIRALPMKNEANLELLRFLGKKIKVAPSLLRITKGHKARLKIIASEKSFEKSLLI